MEGLEPKKLALIRIWQILKEYSDDKHLLTQEEISEHLKREYGIEIERKAIGRNLSLLKEAGVEVESTRNGTYLAGREFEDSELQMLIDSVLCSQHISANYTKDLIKKLCALSNRYFKSGIKNIYSVEEWSKTENKELFYNIEIVDEAIEKNRQVKYVYKKYGLDKKLHKTSQQVVSPYRMLLHNQRYYLMGYSEYWKNMVFHRLDHITNMEIADISAVPLQKVPGHEKGIDYKDLSTARPYMYTDKAERISFVADVRIVDQMIDWFGKDIKFEKIDGQEGKVKVSLVASPMAMKHWTMQYIDYVDVISPISLRESIVNSLNEALKRYQGHNGDIMEEE